MQANDDDQMLSEEKEEATNSNGQKIPKGPGRVLAVLTAIASSPRPVSGGHLAQKLGIPRSTLSLLLRALVEEGAVSTEDQTGLYAPGPLLFRLGLALHGSDGVVRLSRPVMERLAESTQELVYIGVRTGMKVVYLDKVAGAKVVHLGINLGVPREIHSTALGKLFLAYAPDLADRVLAQAALPRLTSATITDPTALRAELSAIRKRGYAVSKGENVEGVLSLSAPVRTPDGEIIAGINLSSLLGSGMRMKNWYAESLVAAAQEVEALLRPPGSGETPDAATQRANVENRQGDKP
jgi:DNA-binding IclR family transcriptional regulator